MDDFSDFNPARKAVAMFDKHVDVVREAVASVIPEDAVLPPEGFDGVAAFIRGEQDQWCFIDETTCYSLSRVSVGEGMFGYRFYAKGYSPESAVTLALVNNALSRVDTPSRDYVFAGFRNYS